MSTLTFYYVPVELYHIRCLEVFWVSFHSFLYPIQNKLVDYQWHKFDHGNHWPRIGKPTCLMEYIPLSLNHKKKLHFLVHFRISKNKEIRKSKQNKKWKQTIKIKSEMIKYSKIVHAKEMLDFDLCLFAHPWFQEDPSYPNCSLLFH